MERRPQGQIDHQVNSLAELRLEGRSMDAIIGDVGRLALASLAGWDAVAATLAQGEKVATYGTTDERINPVDQGQYDTNKGPCVDALKSGEIVYFDGTSVAPEWRQFAEVAANSGVYSTLSFPLRLDGEVIGALNLYSRERDALRPGHREEGLLFASHAAVAIANAKAYLARDAQVGQLEEALQSRTLIGQATGLLMAQEGMTSDEAFQKLVQVSQNSNMKLRDIAQRYVEACEQKVRPTDW